MRTLRSAMLAPACAVAVISAMTYVGAQGNRAQQRDDDGLRHLVYIGTPGDGGTDNQSGVIVLDADKNYSFVKRIPYGLPASMMPGPKISGITASVPLNMIYVASNGWLKAIKLDTDEVAWTFNGESAPVQRQMGERGPRGVVNGCCERPWTLPDGKTLLVASSYNDFGTTLMPPPAKISAN